jgi:hypothetical protein
MINKKTMEETKPDLSNLSIIVIGYDGYSDCWQAFGSFYKKNWPVQPFRTIFVSPTVPFPKDFGIASYLSGQNGQSFSARLSEALNHVETEYVLFLLEDYLITQCGLPQRWSEVLKEMKERDIWFCLLQNFISKPKTKRTPKGQHIAGLKTSTHYAINLQPAIWKASFLRGLMNSSCIRPWDFEIMLDQYCHKAEKEVETHIGYSPYIGFKVFNLIDKGKLTRGYRPLFKQMNLSKPQRSEETRNERFRKRTRIVVSNLMGSKLRSKLKAIGRRHGKTYFTDD